MSLAFLRFWRWFHLSLTRSLFICLLSLILPLLIELCPASQNHHCSLPPYTKCYNMAFLYIDVGRSFPCTAYRTCVSLVLETKSQSLNFLWMQFLPSFFPVFLPLEFKLHHFTITFLKEVAQFSFFFKCFCCRRSLDHPANVEWKKFFVAEK